MQASSCPTRALSFVIDIDGVIGKKLTWTVGDSYIRAKETFSKIEVDATVISRINRLYHKGHTIILHTSRIWHDYNVTVKWLKKHHVKYSTLVMAKPLGDFYIDDKNMSVKEFVDYGE